jgi:cutinase
LVTAAASVPLAVVPALPAGAASCSDVDVVFARGTGEQAGVGGVGAALVAGLTARLPGRTVSVHPVNYAASDDQASAGPGASEMSDHVAATAAACPSTRFVLGGYSQGASVTDIALGIPTLLGLGRRIPTRLAPRVAAVVVFGNPLGITRQSIEKNSPLYGARSKSFCAKGDPVCGNGVDIMAHFAYVRDGSTTAAATFAAARV